MWRYVVLGLVLAVASWAGGQSTPAKNQNQSGPPSSQAPPRSQPAPAPRGPGDSSSRDTQDWNTAPETPDDSVTEMHPWDPHKAQKNVEIGDFYFRQKNYRAALSRYCEALSYKPNDAVSTYKIAETLDKEGDLAGARTYYQSYLKILPEGPFAAHSKKALERIRAQAEIPDKHLAQQQGCETPGKAVRFRPEPVDPDRPVLTRNPAPPPDNPR